MPSPLPLPLPPGLRWQPGFAQLGPAFATPVAPAPLPDPYLVGASSDAATLLGVAAEWLQSRDAALALAGSQPLAGSAPTASVYSGHQFGVWAGQLGDGRAMLLGEADSGWEIQLKGPGPTPYSRMGDGRAVLRSSIREFLCSEAMHALGVPTTRALSVMGSDAPVRRESIETAAVVARTAPSFIRFGHFEHFAATGQDAELRQLADYVIDRYYPNCRGTARFRGNAYAALLAAVVERTAVLLAHWQAVGFCHGVMNTDNMSILGLTIDYGPFQFLDAFDPGHVCNHSDTLGRYAYRQQPNVAYWNLFCLGQALYPLIGDQQLALAALEPYQVLYPQAFATRMRAKLGWTEARSGDQELVEAILKLMAHDAVDYNIFWRRLSHHVAGTDGALPVRDLFLQRDAFDGWLLSYSELLAHGERALAADLMLQSNPKFVLRNHLGEEAIRAANTKDFSVLARLQTLLATPFDEHPGHEDAAGFPPDWARTIEISCSS